MRVRYCSASANREITKGPRCQGRLHRKKSVLLHSEFLRHYIVVSPAGISTQVGAELRKKSYQVVLSSSKLQYVIQARK